VAMLNTQSNQRKTLRIICILFVTVGLVSSLSLSSGTFTLHGSGPDTIQNLTVYFNDVEVHFVTGNTISWQFNTGNYEGGATNITLIGITDTSAPYITTHAVVFIGESLNTLIYIGIIGLVSVLFLAKYGSRLMGLRKK